MKRRGQIALADRLVRLRRTPEQLQRLSLRGGGEGHVGDALVASTSRHLGREHVLSTDLAAVPQFGQLLGRQHLLELCSRFACLRRMRLIGNHREPLSLGCRQLAYLLQCKREGLNGADDDFLTSYKRLCKLTTL